MRHSDIPGYASPDLSLACAQEGNFIPQRAQAGHGRRMPGAAQLGVHTVDMELPSADKTKDHQAACRERRGKAGRPVAVTCRGQKVSGAHEDRLTASNGGANKLALFQRQWRAV